MTELTLIGKPDCHLCDVAREIVESVVAELPDDVADAIEVREASIADDPGLYDLWWEKIPVVLIDDVADAIEVREASIADDPGLYDLWWEKIPVVLIDGRLHAHWRLSQDRLRTALIDAAG